MSFERVKEKGDIFTTVFVDLSVREREKHVIPEFLFTVRLWRVCLEEEMQRDGFVFSLHGSGDRRVT